MKLDFDISAQEYSIIRDILEAHLPKGVTVWVFGSRAKNTARFNSDLDLALKGTEALPKDVIPRLKDAFTDAPIAYRVDLVDMAEVSDSFAEVIRAQAVRFPIEPQGNVPKLRFPGFWGEWQKHKIGELGPVSMCKRIMKDETKPTGDVPFYKIGTFGREADAFISQETFDRYRERYSFPKAGDILISAAGTIGRLVVYDGSPAYFQDSNIVWVANDEEKVSNDFLLSCYQNIRWTTEDTTIARLYNDNLRNMDFAAPTLPEQRKIASFLGAVDTKITQLAEKKRLLEDYKKGCMQQLFSQEIRFKDDDGKDFPDWEEKRLGEITTFSKGKGISKADISEGGATPCIRYGEIYTVYREHITDVRSSTDIDPRVLYMSRSGDVIIPASGEDPLDMARACCVEDDGIALGGDINVLRGAPNGVFLAYYLNNAKRKEIASYAQGNSVVHLYGSQMRNLSIALPHPTEQRKIADFLSAIDRKIDLVGAELEHARSFKQWLLQQMFV